MGVVRQLTSVPLPVIECGTVRSVIIPTAGRTHEVLNASKPEPIPNIYMHMHVQTLLQVQ